METNHSNIGGHLAEKHLAHLVKMVTEAAGSKGETLFGPRPNPDRSRR